MIATPPAIIERIDSVIRAANADDGAAVQSNFTPNATVVDEDAPFLFQGAGAGAQWWRGVDRAVAKAGHGTLQVRVLRVTEYRHDREGDDAYVILSMRVTVTAHGKTSNERGLWALTLHDGGSGWKISSASWATLP